MSHTPRPWRVERVDYELHGLDQSYEVLAGRSVVVQTHMREIKSEDARLAEDEANCRLIAAAPELLEALELFKAFGCPLCNGDCGSANPPVTACPMQAAQTAIAKARGAA